MLVTGLRTRAAVEGALLASLTALLGLVSFYTGFGWLQPIPVWLAYLRLGGRTAVLALLVATGILALWIGPVAAVGTLAFVSAVGLVPGWAVRRGASAALTLACMTLGLLADGVAGYVAALVIWHDNVWSQTWQALHRLLANHAAELARAGLRPADVEHGLRLVLPAALVLAAAAQAAAIYLFAAPVLRRVGLPLPTLPPFARWRAPRWLLWPYAGALAAAALGAHLGNKVAAGAGWNLVAVAGVVYAVAGLATAYGWLRRRGVRRARAAAAVAAGAWLLALLGLGVLVPAVGLLASYWPAPVGE